MFNNLTPAEKDHNDQLEAAINDGILGGAVLLYNIIYNRIYNINT